MLNTASAPALSGLKWRKMSEKTTTLKRPRGLMRLAFRMPIGFYRLGLGCLLGTRFVLLNHTGRKSGLSRQTVLEVVRYNKSSGECIIASGWGERSDWYHNIVANTRIQFQIANRCSAGIAERLTPEESGKELLNYAHRHPLAFRELAKFMGFKFNGTENDILAAGKTLPMFILKPLE
jgi:deazaflavin-dependent oxidoreductase (nitroreductase family)